MKLLVILFSAFFVTELFDVGLAVSQTAPPAQAVSAVHQQALDECRARYAGSEAIAAARGLTGGRTRSDLWRDRWVFVDACFKEKTGMYPFQTNVKCNLPYRRFRSLRCLQKMSLLSTTSDGIALVSEPGGAGNQGRAAVDPGHLMRFASSFVR